MAFANKRTRRGQRSGDQAVLMLEQHSTAPNTRQMPLTKCLVLHALTVIVCHHDVVRAQTMTLPDASRTVFRCQVNGKVAYSDQPCLGADRLTIQPTRGMNAATGKERTGRDVAREQRHETLVEAVKPLTGMDQEQFEKASRRTKLDARGKAKCNALDAQIDRLEKGGRELPAADKARYDLELLEARTHYRRLRC